jgi:hemoglobin
MFDFLKKKPKTPYQQLGAANGLQQLVDHFYSVMDTDPKAHECRALHGKDLSQAKSKLFDFLSGWLGGPPLFEEKYGHPRLRMRHFPFAIGPLERDQWLYCMNQAMEKMSLDVELKNQMRNAFEGLAERVRNKD